MHDVLPGFSMGCERLGLFVFSPLTIVVGWRSHATH